MGSHAFGLGHFIGQGFRNVKALLQKFHAVFEPGRKFVFLRFAIKVYLKLARRSDFHCPVVMLWVQIQLLLRCNCFVIVVPWTDFILHWGFHPFLRINCTTSLAFAG